MPFRNQAFRSKMIAMRCLCWLAFLFGVGFPVMAQREAYEKAVCQPGIQNYPALDSLNLIETKDSMITELTYCTVLYPNGHKQIEGYKCRRKYDPIYFQYYADTRDLTKNDTVDLKVGWMKEYYKSGKISAINYLPYDVTREVVMTGFAEYGDTLRQYRFKILTWRNSISS